jgi:hypothetical protein
MRPNGGGGGAWHLTFTLSPAVWDDSPVAGIIRLLFLIQIYKLKILRKMKKIKLFALAAFAMLSTNAFAAHVLTTGNEQTINGISYKVLTVYNTEDATAGKINTVSAEQNNFTGSTLTIPATVDIAVEGVDDEATPVDIKKTATFKVVEVVDFSGLSGVTTISVGANVETIDPGAFAGMGISTLDISGTKVTYIDDWFKKGAVTSNATLTTVKLPASAEEIDDEAFTNCSKLNTVTFAALLDNDGVNPNDNVTTINAGAFEGTAITELDLTNTKITTLNPLFTHNATPWTKNKKLSSITLPKSLATIAANAFNNCMLLETIDFTACTTALTIEANAFENTIFLEALELPACVAELEDDALDGSYISELTITSNESAGYPILNAIGGDELKSIIVNGAFVGVFGNAGGDCVSTTITSLTFKGTVAAGAILAGAFTKSANLATVTFEGSLAAGAVAAGAFGDDAYHAGSGLGGGKMLNVIYRPTKVTSGAGATNVQSFAAKAFANTDDTDDDTNVAKLSTATWYKDWLTSEGAALVEVLVDAAAATKTVAVANNGEGKYYYASLIADAKYRIAASQNGGKVMVYAAYMDQVKSDSKTTNTAYMDQLHIIGGYYYLPAIANTAYVIKSTTADPVLVEATDKADDSNHYATGDDNLNKIKVTTEELLGQELMNANPGKDVYFLAPFEEYGLFWTKFKATRTLPEGTLYMTIDAAAGARLHIVWLDGSEEDQTTAIQAVEKTVEDGITYNLAGQKVNASYKGVVIKNGKKMIQK